MLVTLGSTKAQVPLIFKNWQTLKNGQKAAVFQSLLGCVTYKAFVVPHYASGLPTVIHCENVDKSLIKVRG